MEKLKDILSFLGRFLLANVFWIVPLVFLAVLFKVLWLVIVPFLVTFIFLSWRHADRKKQITVQRTGKLIPVIYSGATFIFFMLTGISTYEGIIDVFGVTSGFYRFFVFFFAAGIITGLWLITLMIKSRKTPGVLLGLIALYLLFDCLTALPYNFLFFYESVQRADYVRIDKDHIDTVFAVCNPLFAAREKTARAVLASMGTQRNYRTANDTMKRHQDHAKALAKLKIRRDEPPGMSDEAYRDAKIRLEDRYGARSYSLTQKEIDSLDHVQGRVTKYHNINAELTSCAALRSRLENTFNTDEQADICDQLKNRLRVVCDHPEEKALEGKAALMVGKKRTSLEAVKDLYRFLGSFHPGETRLPAPDAVTEEQDMLLKSSLASSIVIDFLPLLLSILYAKFGRHD